MKTKISLQIILTVLSIFPILKLSAQSEKIISIVPQYAFQNGFRVDYEFNLHDDWKSWLQFSPVLFINTDGDDITSYYYNSMSGFGLEVHHKYFMQEPDDRRGFYFAYGGGMQFISLKDDQMMTYDYIENGVPYTSYKNEEVSTAIKRLMLNVMVGRQVVRYKPFIIDYYLGIGFRYSMDKDLNLIDDFNDTWFDYGYSGSLIVAGIKLGFNFSK